MKLRLPFLQSRENNIMLDFETLAKSADAVIISIGAVRFDDERIYDSFYRIVDPESCIKYGMKIDPKTIEWWQKQSPEAKAEFENNEGESIREVLRDFRVWIVSPPFSSANDYQIWGNGAAFDNVLLHTALALTNVQELNYTKDRCYRTMNASFGKFIDSPQRTGVYHKAVDDAFYQAKKLQLINELFT